MKIHQPNPSSAKAGWERRLGEKIYNLVDRIRSAEADSDYGSWREDSIFDEKVAINETITIVRKILASELAKERSRMAKEIEKMKRKVVLGIPDGFYNLALTEAAKRVRGR